MKDENYLSVRAVSMGIACSIVGLDFFHYFQG
jgi:hypothetical protein